MSNKFLPVYRIENPTHPYENFYSRDDAYYNRSIAGMWFDLNLDGAISHATNVGAVDSKIYPAHLAIALLDTVHTDEYRPSVHPVASRMNYFPDDFIVPRDDSVPIFTADISAVVSEYYLKSPSTIQALHKIAWFTLKESGLYTPPFRSTLASLFRKYP